MTAPTTDPDRVGWLGWIAVVGWGSFATLNLLSGRVNAAALHASLAATQLGLMVVLGPSRAGVWAWLCTSLAGLLATAMVSGQGNSWAMWWFAGVPLLAAYAFPPREAMGWSLVAVVAITAGHLAGVVLPLPAEFTVVGAELWLGQVTMTGVFFAVTQVARRVNEAQVGLIAAASERERALTDELQAKNAELEAALRRAERIASARERFATALSHEIRTPLNGILGMAQLLGGENDRQRQREYAAELHRSGRALLRLVNDVIDYSQLRTGALSIERSGFPVHEAVEDALEVFAAQAWSDGVDLAVVPGAGVPDRLVGDAPRVHQLVANLVGNALRHANASEVCVMSSLDARGWLVLEVRDTGVGIPIDRLAEVWEPWVPGEGHRVGGAGIGLALVKEIAVALGGSVEVSTRPGKGSTFTLTLPAEPARDAAPVVRPAGLPERVLVALAPGATRQGVVARCQRWGLRVALVEGAEQLAAALADGGYDAAVVEAGWLDRASVAVGLAPIVPVHRSGQGGATEGLPIPVRSATLAQALRAAVTHEATEDLDGTGFDAGLAERAPWRVLVAEDNATNQRVLALLLRRFGYDARIVADGAAAVTAFAEGGYDLVLMDWSMPVLDGISAAGQILARWPGARIVMVSAGYDATQRQRCLDLGVTEFLDKPVQVEGLRRVLEGGGWVAAPATPPHRPPIAAVDPADPVEVALDQLLALCRGDHAEVHGLVEVWSGSVRDRLAALAVALTAGDRDAIARAAHVIKGSSGAFGAHGLALEAGSLESAAPNLPEAELAAAVQSLDLAARTAVDSIHGRALDRGGMRDGPAGGR